MASCANFHEVETRTIEALEEAFWVVDNADDEDVRDDTIDGFRGVKGPFVVRRLLDLLANDPVSNVRENAARILLEHVKDPDVLAALRKAATEDPDEEVREVDSEAE